jgi:hypothetical protein
VSASGAVAISRRRAGRVSRRDKRRLKSSRNPFESRSLS